MRQHDAIINLIYLDSVNYCCQMVWMVLQCNRSMRFSLILVKKSYSVSDFISS